MSINNQPTILIFDVDGVMTSGQFLYSSNGKVYKIFGAHDSDGLKLLKNKLIPNETTIYVCQDKACKSPVNSIEKALNQINK